jgi:hypothetical protein
MSTPPTLLERARRYQIEYRQRLREDFLREREDRHGKGELYFDGFWSPRSAVPKLKRRLRERDRTISIEIVVLVVLSAVSLAGVWAVFDWIFYPD